MNRTKRQYLNKQAILFIISEIIYDVVDLYNGDCEDPLDRTKSIIYSLNIISDQIDKYYVEVEI